MDLTKSNTSAITHSARIGFALLAWIFVVCVLLQIFYAGLAVFSSTSWARHTGFVHLFEFLPFLMTLLAFAGKMRHGMRWWPLSLFLLIGLQYMTAHITGAANVSALHPVIAIIIFYVGITIALKSVRTPAHKSNS
jgi:hypothetical protein